ncbi:hypothetical protein [Streptomyces agglomeratus]|uniref:hypothetical protein n=1 Tax=Streptomyces agglomeratus TaxID=285458 RepID=UPI00210C90E3|nr:hypothetical protein [Streptomyces agglomeratus]
MEQWAEEGRRTVVDIADMLGVPPAAYAADPLTLIPALQNYVSRLPLNDFEDSDWVTLHSDLIAYVADYLIQKHGARWNAVADADMPRGYRYVIEASGRDGEVRRVDPADVVMKEFRNLPVEIVRMLASAELTLNLSSQAGED